MTCASCAARIEKKLNRMDGVTASVNYATEKAKVTFADTVTPDDLIAQIEATGYTARLPRPAAPTVAATVDGRRPGRRPHRVAPATADHLGGPGRAGDRDGDDPGAAVRRLAVAVAHARRPGRRLGCVAVPQGRLDEPAPRRGDDGHADLGRHARRVRLVACTPCSSATPASCRCGTGSRSDPNEAWAPARSTSRSPPA